MSSYAEAMMSNSGISMLAWLLESNSEIPGMDYKSMVSWQQYQVSGPHQLLFFLQKYSKTLNIWFCCSCTRLESDGGGMKLLTQFLTISNLVLALFMSVFIMQISYWTHNMQSNSILSTCSASTHSTTAWKSNILHFLIIFEHRERQHCRLTMCGYFGWWDEQACLHL